ncbi:vacuolar protein sorting-associated protein 16 [Histomonas meleagridis]|uniref:vacuolar protein sorting-associated protein 16-like n=1 Tax=Histomonas meleagridis TaxID=135588 RepID=UPI00355A7074|nr:vacuolar protein sorting-associated protein 16 [Histomonas meleagridis]KAH0806134.1 vacuolar protein sorting-associated protein 16-like [Histomonas meleagridis]
MWNELDEFTRIPNPEVGWDIFASVCLEYNEIDHALKFISLIKDKKRQMEVFVRHGLFSQAAKIARELGLNDLAKDYDKKGKAATV